MKIHFFHTIFERDPQELKLRFGPETARAQSDIAKNHFTLVHRTHCNAHRVFSLVPLFVLSQAAETAEGMMREV